MSTYPKSEFYDIGALLTQMGIGEAAVTILSSSGVPTPVVHTRLRAPSSRMAPADDVDAAAKASPLWAKYGTRVDAQSAREMLAARLAPPAAAPAPPPAPAQQGAPAQPAPKPGPSRRPTTRRPARRSPAAPPCSGKFLNVAAGHRPCGDEVVRGLFGLLKK